MSKYLLTTVFFSILWLCADAQQISSSQQEKFKNDAKNAATTYFNILQLIGMPNYSTNEEMDMYKQEIFNWFENDKSQVYNNLSDTEPTLSIRQYLSDVQSIFPKNGVRFTQEIKDISTVYYHQQEDYYFVKLQTESGIKGINTKGKSVENNKELDFIIKIQKVPYKVQIANILPHKDDLMKRDNAGNRLFVPVTIPKDDNNEISSAQQEKFREDAQNAAITYFNIMQLIGMQDYADNNELQKYKREIFNWFESQKTQVYNNLSDSDPTLPINQYLSDIQTIFPKNGVTFTQEIKDTSTVYYHQQEDYYFVKVQTESGIKGINTKGKSVENNKELDFIIKIQKAPYKVQIANILPHKDDLMKRDNAGNRLFVPVTITQDDNNEFADFEEFQKMLKAAEKRKAELDQREARIRENERLISQRLNEIRKEKERLRIEKEKQERIEREQAEKERRQKEKADSLRREKAKQQAKEDSLRREAAEQQAKEEKLKKAEEEQRKRELLATYKRFFINIGGGVYRQSSPLKNMINDQTMTVDNRTGYQINASLGFRFDFHRNMVKLRRGSLLGVFGRYGINSSDIVKMNIANHNLKIPEDKLDPIFNSYLEVETGFVFHEVLRISTGFGKTNQFAYNTATTALYLNFSPFSFEVATTAMFGRDFDNVQFRPAASLYFQFNDGGLKKLPENNNRLFFFGIGYNHPFMIVNNSLSQGFDTDYFSNQITGEFGFNLGTKHKMGVFANFGLITNPVADKIVNDYNINMDYDPENKYNTHTEIQGGFIFWRMWKISYGIGKLMRATDSAVDYNLATMGLHIPFRRFKFKLDVSTLFIDNNYSKPIYRISPGLLLNINFAG